jgi:hypothetical protein
MRADVKKQHLGLEQPSSSCSWRKIRACSETSSSHRAPAPLAAR